MMFINAGDFKQALVEHYYAKRAKRNARSHLNLIHVVDLEVAGLFNPVFNEGIAQGMLGIGVRKIGPFDYETVFAHVASIFTSRVGLTLSPWSVTIQQNNLRQTVSSRIKQTFFGTGSVWYELSITTRRAPHKYGAESDSDRTQVGDIDYRINTAAVEPEFLHCGWSNTEPGAVATGLKLRY